MLLMVLVSVPVAEAGTIVFFDTVRSLSANGEFYSTTATGASAEGSNVNSPDGFQNAEQISNIAQTFIGGTLNTNAMSGGAGGPVTDYTELFTRFMLDSDYTADLHVGITARYDGYAEGYLYDEIAGMMLAEVRVMEGVRQLMFDGVLPAGAYSIYLLTRASGDGEFTATANAVGGLSLTPFTPVPEPATLTMLGIGLAATAWRRRRSRFES